MKQRVNLIINEWDPIDLFPMAPKDEYIREIDMIENIVREKQRITIKELAFEIHRIFSTRFGSDVYTYDVKYCEKIAERILE